MSLLITGVVFLLVGCACFVFKRDLAPLFERLENWSQNVGPNKYILYRFKSPMKASEIEPILKLLGICWLVLGAIVVSVSGVLLSLD